MNKEEKYKKAINELADSYELHLKQWAKRCIDTINEYTTDLQQENKQLKENYDRIYNENCKLREEHNITDISLLDENYKLKDNWNKLKEIIKKEQDYYMYRKDNRYRGFLYKLSEKMQELEQGSDSK